MKQKIQMLLSELNHGLVEREATMKIALLAVFSGENSLIIGPPGTGKSLIARRISECLERGEHAGADYFEYLLTRFSTPEEIFGPLSIAELKADRFRRNTTGYLPAVRMAFLDEIFKASSAILNALLAILNERVYHNGAERQRVPLQALIAASNEIPSSHEELAALYDRFLVRLIVDYVSEENIPRLFVNHLEQPLKTKITPDELAWIGTSSASVVIPPDISALIQDVLTRYRDAFREDRREYVSDRRLKHVLHVLRVSASTNGRQEIDLSDVVLMQHCLWNHPDNSGWVRDLVIDALHDYCRQAPRDEGERASSEEMVTDSGVQSGGILSEGIPAGRRKAGQMNAMEKGYKGMGTADDPILIESLQDLMGLDYIGAKGYCFRQTADIDCNDITTWTTIVFQGRYDGGGHAIKYRTVGDTSHELFVSVHPESGVRGLKLIDLRLAGVVTGSDIDSCETNLALLGEVSESSVSFCQSGGYLISNSASHCTITACKSRYSLILETASECGIHSCQSGGFLIWEHAINSTITDCLVEMDLEWNTSADYAMLGGVASTASSSVIERCLVIGKLVNHGHGEIGFSGVSSICDASSIRHCAIGKFELGGGDHVHWNGRVLFEDKGGGAMEGNVSIDSNQPIQNNELCDGKSVSQALFNQRTFECTLGWDFDRVWSWNAGKGYPVLRSVGVGARPVPEDRASTTKGEALELLSRQVLANIWL